MDGPTDLGTTHAATLSRNDLPLACDVPGCTTMATVDNGGEILQDTSGRCYAFCQTHAAEVLKDRLIQRVL